MKPFARAVAGALLTLGLAVAQAAYAGTAYIPLPGVSAVGPVSYRTQISITNTIEEPLAVDSLQLGPGTDGTLREGRPAARFSIVPKKTFVFRPDSRARGLLELDGPAGLHYSARLVGTNGARVELPVITSDSLGQADEMLVVQGLEGSRARITDIVLLNLGDADASCSASVMRADGSYVVKPVELSLAPLSSRVLANVFGSLAGGIAEARAEVTCSNDFYVYAQTSDVTTGQLTIAGPSASSDSLLAITEEISAAAVLCSNGSTLCAIANEVHTSTKAAPTKALVMTPPADTYRSLTGHVEVRVSGWNKTNLRGAHGVLYLIINKNKLLLGNIFLRGPEKNNVTLRHGVCPGGCNKAKVEKGIAVDLNTTYAFDYVYDAANRTIDMRMTHNGELVAQIKDKSNVNRIQIKPGDKVVIGLSNPDVNSFEEPASLGWTYSNLRVEFFR